MGGGAPSLLPRVAVGHPLCGAEGDDSCVRYTTRAVLAADPSEPAGPDHQSLPHFRRAPGVLFVLREPRRSPGALRVWLSGRRAAAAGGRDMHGAAVYELLAGCVARPED